MKWLVVVSLFLCTLEPNQARACGGFFCNNATPVNQAAERIVFARASDGTVTAIIQIQYAGPAERFAWMPPVAGSPTVSVSSDTAFTALQTATNPTYSLTTRVEGECDVPERRGWASADAGALIRADAGAMGPVTVVDEGSVGPYDYVVISVDPSAPDSVGAAVAWLNDNMYDVTAEQAEVVRPYLESGLNLLTFRLTKGNDTGTIRPVRITFGSGLASIPIRPTAVAATSNMGVMVWVLGPSRAVPVNYLSLELNEALVDWFNPTPTYNDVVTVAANEAGGQGFVTELAAPTVPGPGGTSYRQIVYPPILQSAAGSILETDWSARRFALVEAAITNFGAQDGFRDAFIEGVPLPADTTFETVMACPSCFDDHFETSPDFDPPVFVAALERHVFDPLEETAALFEAHPYITRLYTTMSADEMTVDPMFDFNSDLPDHSNQHTAERVIECGSGILEGDAYWRVELPDGRVVRGRDSSWPFGLGDMPANARTLRVGTSGEGDVNEDNGEAIDRVLGTHNATVPTPSERDGCACTSSGSPAGFALVALVLAALWRRKR
jgi:MYXO-CTERM domain-containing protein